MRIKVTALLLAAALGGCAQTGARIAPDTDALPTDVVAFLERRVLCEHFLQEEPYDAERRAFLERGIAATCAGTDATLLGLRDRYRDDPDISERLAQFEYPLGF